MRWQAVLHRTVGNLAVIDDGKATAIFIIVPTAAVHPLIIHADEPLQHSLFGQGGFEPCLMAINLHDHQHFVSLIVNRVLFADRPIRFTSYLAVCYSRPALLVEYKAVMTGRGPVIHLAHNRHSTFTHLSHHILLDFIL